MAHLSSYLFTNVASIPPTYNVEVRIFKHSIIASIQNIKEVKSNIVVNFKTIYNNKIFFEEKYKLDLLNQENNLIVFKTKCPTVAKEDELSFIEIDVYSENNDLIFSNRGLVNGYTFFYKDSAKSYLTELVQKYGHPNIITQYQFFNTFVFTSPNVLIDKKKDISDTIGIINPYEKDIIIKITTNHGNEIKQKIKARSGKKIFLDQIIETKDSKWEGCIHITGNNRVLANIFKTSIKNRYLIHDAEHLDYYFPDKNYIGSFKYLRSKIANFLFKKGMIKKARKEF